MKTWSSDARGWTLNPWLSTLWNCSLSGGRLRCGSEQLRPTRTDCSLDCLALIDHGRHFESRSNSKSGSKCGVDNRVVELESRGRCRPTLSPIGPPATVHNGFPA